MIDSPIDSLYHLIKSIFSPALRSTNSNQQIQNSLNELEEILRAKSKKSDGSTSMSNIFHPKDEIFFWNDVMKSGSKDSERASYFLTILDPIRKDLTNFEK